MQLAFSVEILRPRDEVFVIVSHLENDPKWQSAVQQSQRLTPGPTRVGTRFRQEVVLAGTRTGLDLEFNEFSPQQSYRLRCTCGPLVFDSEVRFTATRAGTFLEALVSGRSGGIARIAANALSRLRRSEIEADLGNLKRLLEAGEIWASPSRSWPRSRAS